MSRGKKKYRRGDQIHIIVTPDFEDTITEFMEYCRENNINASALIRSLISSWMEEKRKELRISEIVEKKMAERYEKNILFEERV